MFPKLRYRSWIQVFVPTKDRHGRKLPKSDVKLWQSQVEQLFRQYLAGYNVGPHYRIKGAYKTDGGDWISEPNFLVRGSGPTGAVRALAAALKESLLVEMGQALKQESVAVESSVFGFEVYYMDEGDHGA